MQTHAVEGRLADRQTGREGGSEGGREGRRKTVRTGQDKTGQDRTKQLLFSQGLIEFDATDVPAICLTLPEPHSTY